MAKKAKPLEKKEEVFFVGVKDPIGMRRAVLESSKDVVQSLQRFEKFTAARKKKRESIEQLKSIVQEAVGLVNKLKRNMPSGGLRMKPVEKPKPVPAAPKKLKKPETKQQPQKPLHKSKEMGELEKLETELSDIESKLGSLT